jgi:hypothetical protein
MLLDFSNRDLKGENVLTTENGRCKVSNPVLRSYLIPSDGDKRMHRL